MPSKYIPHPRVRQPVAPRLWAKVNKDGPIPEHRPELGPCWIWTACLSTKGYGRIMANGRVQNAHRVAYELTYGPIPPEQNVCHACDNPLCVRPSHMFLGTQTDNIRDMFAKGRNVSLGPRKLSPEQVDEVFELYAGGASSSIIAAQYGVTGTTICRIIGGQGYARK
jgi:hypothetical protein